LVLRLPKDRYEELFLVSVTYNLLDWSNFKCQVKYLWSPFPLMLIAQKKGQQINNSCFEPLVWLLVTKTSSTEFSYCCFLNFCFHVFITLANTDHFHSMYFSYLSTYFSLLTE
jgi:hypothetical protein